MHFQLHYMTDEGDFSLCACLAHPMWLSVCQGRRSLQFQFAVAPMELCFCAVWTRLTFEMAFIMAFDPLACTM